MVLAGSLFECLSEDGKGTAEECDAIVSCDRCFYTQQ